ncbi:MAG: DUF5685 family protein [Lachnospiraceae bacterium]|nr:DUF5685 family protein [Lachnospiraceae bacterium]
MFGYINANQEVMSAEDRDTYKAFYCGLCRKLKELGGWKAQVLLNYDMTFLIILLSGLYELESKKYSFSCAMHPGKKQFAYDNEAVTYCAKMNIVLGYHNLMDDYADSKNLSKKTLANSYKKVYTAIREEYPEKVAAVERMMDAIRDAESRREENLDVMAGYMGTMLGELFVWKDDVWNKGLRDMGYYMGKFIYIMDAYDDLEKDEKDHNYNPLLMKKNCNRDCYEVFCQQALTSMVSECAKSFECLPILEHAEILRNILYSGIWTKYEYKQIKLGNRMNKEKQDGSISGIRD